MQLELSSRGNVCVALLRCCAGEHDRRPVDRHLQRLKVTAVFDAVGVLGNKAVDERVRLPALVKVHRRGGRARGTAGIFDDIDIAEPVGVNPLIAALAQKSVQLGELRRPAGRELEGSAIAARFLREQQGSGKRIVGRAIDRSQSGSSGRRVNWRQQRDAMNVAARNIEVDPRHVRLGRPVLVALIQEVSAVIKVGGRPAGIARKNHIGVLIGLGQRAIAQHPVIRDDAAWIFQRVGAGREQFCAEIRIDQRGRHRIFLIGRGNAVLDHADTVDRPSRG